MISLLANFKAIKKHKYIATLRSYLWGKLLKIMWCLCLVIMIILMAANWKLYRQIRWILRSNLFMANPRPRNHWDLSCSKLWCYWEECGYWHLIDKRTYHRKLLLGILCRTLTYLKHNIESCEYQYLLVCTSNKLRSVFTGIKYIRLVPLNARQAKSEAQ